MTKFTNEQIKELQERARDIAQETANGSETIDIMTKLYVESFDGKTEEQGKLIAESIIEAVQNFEVDYKEAKIDIDHFIRKFQHKVDKDKTCYERCNYWKQFAAAVTAATIAANDENANAKDIAAKLEQINVSEEEANEALEEKLRELAFEAIKDSNIMVRTLAENINTFESIDNADETANLLIDLGNENVDYRAIVAMLAYINNVKGEYPEVPIDISAAQLATIVCVETEQIEIVEALERGDITMTAAEGALYVLGIVAIFQMAVLSSVIAVSIAFTMFSSILAIPAAAALVAGIIHITGEGIRKWELDSKTIVSTVVKGVRGVFRGTKKLYGALKNSVIPKLVNSCKEKLNKLFNTKKETTQEVVTEPATC
ncbi:MAG: hypothetical protein IJ643_05130 [Eubacterium sp.]|nr:hypothetical protein [Eubacterium sp.]